MVLYDDFNQHAIPGIEQFRDMVDVNNTWPIICNGGMLDEKKMNEKTPMSAIFFWIRHVVLVIVGVFFMLFGIHVLISAYQLNDPFAFILTFFASNFIILISAALIIGFIYRMKAFLKNSNEPQK